MSGCFIRFPTHTGFFGAPPWEPTNETLMEKAGYLPSSDAGSAGKKRAAFAIDDVTAAEEEQLLEYLAFLRSRVRP